MKRGGSRVLLRFFCLKTIQDHSLTAKTRFTYSLSFILCIYSSWDDPEPSPLSNTFIITMVTSNGILILDPALKFHSHVLLQAMKHKQLLSSKILAKTTPVPTNLSKDSYPSGETLATPYVRDNELLQCEVNIHYINDIIHLRMDLSRSRYQKPATKKFFINIGKSKEILKKVNANQYQHNKII